MEEKFLSNQSDKDGYDEKTPLIDDNFEIETKKQKKHETESVSANNDARFNNFAKYSENQKNEEKKEEKKSKMVKHLEANNTLSFLAMPIHKFESAVKNFFSLFRGTPLFFEENFYTKIINISLFYLAYLSVIFGFFNGYILLLPLFFIVIDFIYFFSHKKLSRKGKPNLTLFNNGKPTLFGIMTLIILSLYIYVYIGNIDWSFSQSNIFMKILNYLTYVYLVYGFFSVTRKHLLTIIFCFIAFYSVSSQQVFVINWNNDWSNPYTKINQINKLSYNYYVINKNDAVIESINPYDFFKIKTLTEVDFGVLYVDVIYNYKLSNQIFQKIKNAKCLKVRLINCNQNKTDKYQKEDGGYIDSLRDYKILLKYNLSNIQQEFIDNLDVKTRLPFKPSDYDKDIKILYQNHLNRDDNNYLSIREKLELNELKVNVDSVSLGQTLFDRNKKRSKFNQ